MSFLKWSASLLTLTAFPFPLFASGDDPSALTYEPAVSAHQASLYKVSGSLQPNGGRYYYLVQDNGVWRVEQD